jgi:hypothetical protein
MCAALSINDASSPGSGSRLPDGMVGDPYATTLTAGGRLPVIFRFLSHPTFWLSVVAASSLRRLNSTQI